MTARLSRLGVVGLGLLGGSVALAARARGVAARVVGVARSAEVRAAALARGVVDEAIPPGDPLGRADLVVLATPVFAMPDAVRALAPGLAAGSLVTDVGSVKSWLADTLPGLLPPGVVYVGSHPMAGSHHRGLEHARADLFASAACIVMEGGDPQATARVAGFWRDLGARVVLRDPAAHDAEVAWMSHVPHALAFAFAHALADAPDAAFEVQGPGIRDFTRIAHSDPELWAEILSGNRKALAAPLQAVARALAELARGLEAEDVDGVERFIATARASLSRSGARRSRPGTGEPETPTAGWPGGAPTEKPTET